MRYWSLKKLITYITFYYPVLYMCIYMISDALARRFALMLLILLFFGIITKKGKSSISTILFLFCIALLAIYNCGVHGIAYVLSLDFYGWILLLLVFHYYSSLQCIDGLKELMLNEKNALLLLRLFYLLLIISIVFLDGLRVSFAWGVSVPILYGPYEIPHGLAYSLILMYVIPSIQFRNTKKRRYFIYMMIAVIACIWTGARSGILAMAIVICADYLSIRKISVKVLLPVFMGIVILYLGLFTDVLYNNPLTQKTMDALSRNNITNGRETFNTYLIDYYLHHLSIIQKLFGVGVENIREYMSLRFGTFIHAHNDLLNTLVGFGLFGMLIFAKELISFIKMSTKWGWLLLILMVMIYYNGLYMYIGFSASVPLLAAYLNCIYEQSKVTEKTISI